MSAAVDFRNDLVLAGGQIGQTYTVTLLRGLNTREEIRNAADGGTTYSVPLYNQGEKTFPDYEQYRDRFVHEGTLPGGEDMRVFAGAVEDPFWIDFRAALDSLNLRTTAPLPRDPDLPRSSTAGSNENAIAVQRAAPG